MISSSVSRSLHPSIHLASFLFFIVQLLNVSNSLWPHGLQHARLLCPPVSPGVCSNWGPLSQCCYVTISSLYTPFSFCFQSSPASRSFPKSWLFLSGGQNIVASASVLPMNIQGWLPLGLTGLILQSKRLSRVLSSTTIQKHQFFGIQPSLWSSSQKVYQE